MSVRKIHKKYKYMDMSSAMLRNYLSDEEIRFTSEFVVL